MRLDLSELPHLKPHALLGDLCLLAGQRAQALDIYTRAWSLDADAAALDAWVALEGRVAPLDLLMREGQRLREFCAAQRLPARAAERSARWLISTLLWVRREPAAAASLALALAEALPEASLPCSLEERWAAPDAWRKATEALRAATLRPHDKDRDAERREHLRTKARLWDARAGLPPAQEDLGDHLPQGVALVGALAALDLSPPHCAQAAELDALEPALRHLAAQLQDRRERAVYALRWAERRWAQGALGEARALLEGAAAGGPTPLDAVLWEHQQRLSCASSAWAEAAGWATRRAERCDDAGLRAGLLWLALEYLHRAQGPAEARSSCAERLLGLEGRGVSPGALLAAWEAREAALVETRADEDLLALWRRWGALSEAHRGSARPPVERWQEAFLLAGERAVGRKAVAEEASLRRFAVVQALGEQRPLAALQWLRAAPSLREEERLLRAMLALSLPAQPGEHEQARHEVEELCSVAALGPGRDVLALYVLRALLLERGEVDKVRALFAQAWPSQDPALQAAMQTRVGRDLLHAGRPAESLPLARAAFGAAPTDPAARALLRDCARACDDQDALALLSALVDEERLLDLLPEPLRAPWAALHAQEAQDPRAAAQGLEELAQEEPLPPLAQAALWRRAGELWGSLHEHERALEAWAWALEAHPEDRLSARLALELHLSQGPPARLAAWASRVRWRDPLPPALGARLLREGHAQAPDDPDTAWALLEAGAWALGPAERASTDLKEALEALERLSARAHEGGARWRALLEGLARRERDGELVAWLHARLGSLCEDQGSHDEAIEHWRRALLGEESRKAALRGLVRAFERRGSLESLVSVLTEEAQRLAGKGRVAVLEALAELLAERLGRPADAKAALEELLRQAPRHLSALRTCAALAFSQQRWAEGEGYLEAAARLVEDQRERSAIYQELGRVREQLGNPLMALESYMVSFICDNRNAATFARLEALYTHFGRWKELVGIYEVAAKAVAQDPAASPSELEALHVRRARVEQDHLGRELAAAQAWLEALRLNPGREEYVRRIEDALGEHHPELLAEAYGALAGATQGEAALAAMRQQARLLARVPGRAHQAQEVYRRVLALDPADAAAWEVLEGLYKDQERWGELVGLYQARFASAPDGEPAIGLARAIAQIAERKLRDFDLAISTFEALLARHPDHGSTVRSLARLYEATRRWDGLIEVSQRELALTEEPEKKAHVWFKIGSVHETARQDMEAAIACYREALALDPRCVPALHGLRELFRRQGRWEEVVQTLEDEARLWDKPRERAGVLAMMAEVCLEQLGDAERAELWLKESLGLQEGLPRAARLLMDLYASQGRWAEALPLSDALLKGSEGQPLRARARLWAKRAWIERQGGDPGAAAQSLSQALELDMGDEEALGAFLELLEQGAVPPKQAAQAEEALGRLAEQLEAKGLTQGLARVTLYRARQAARAMRPEQAQRLGERAREVAPGSWEAARWASAWALRWGRAQEAAQVWEGLIEHLSSQEHSSQEPLARSLVALAALRRDHLGQPQEAWGLYERASALGGGAGLRYEQAQCLWLLGRAQEALGVVRALRADAAQGEEEARAAWAFYEGRLHERLGDAPSAEEAWREAATLGGPSSRLAAWLALAQLHAGLGAVGRVASVVAEAMRDEALRGEARWGELGEARAWALAQAPRVLPPVPSPEVMSLDEDLVEVVESPASAAPFVGEGAEVDAPELVEVDVEDVPDELLDEMDAALGSDDADGVELEGALEGDEDEGPQGEGPSAPGEALLGASSLKEPSLKEPSLEELSLEGSSLRGSSLEESLLTGVEAPGRVEGALGGRGGPTSGRGVEFLSGEVEAVEAELEAAISAQFEAALEGEPLRGRATRPLAIEAVLERELGPPEAAPRPEDPADVAALCAWASQADARTKARVGRWLDALGVGAQEDGAPSETLQGLALAPSGGPWEESLGLLQGLLARAFPSGLHALELPSLEQHPRLRALVEEWSVGANASGLVAVRVGSDGSALKFCNQRVVGRGALPVPLVLVPLEWEVVERGDEHAQAAARFALAQGARWLASGLAVVRAMRPVELGHVLEVVARLGSGEPLEEVQEREPLKGAARKLKAYGLAKLVPGLVEAMAGWEVEGGLGWAALGASLLSQGEAQADRAGLWAVGEVGVALDVVLAQEEGRPAQALDGAARVAGVRRSPRARALAWSYLAEEG